MGNKLNDLTEAPVRMIGDAVGKLFRFRIGFAIGYLVAVIRRADENDPVIRGIKRADEGVRRATSKLTS